MKIELEKFFKKLKDIYGEKLKIYLYSGDLYHIAYKGYGIDTFTLSQFYEYPWEVRLKNINKQISVGFKFISDKEQSKRLKKWKKGRVINI